MISAILSNNVTCDFFGKFLLQKTTTDINTHPLGRQRSSSSGLDNPNDPVVLENGRFALPPSEEALFPMIDVSFLLFGGGVGRRKKCDAV